MLGMLNSYSKFFYKKIDSKEELIDLLKTKNGSKGFQEKILHHKHCSEISTLINFLNNDIAGLMMDPFGNYAVNVLYEISDSFQRSQIIGLVRLCEI